MKKPTDHDRIILPLFVNTNFHGIIPKGNVPQADQRTMVSRAITKQLERHMWIVVKTWGDNYYDIQLGSTFVLDFNFQTGKLENTGNYSNTNVERYSRVFNSTGIKLEVGDQCRIAFRDHDINQKPYIKSTNRMPSGQKSTTDIINPPVVGIPGLWPQSAASVQKDWLGDCGIDFGDAAVLPATIDDWARLFYLGEADADRRLESRENLYPSLLVVKEMYTDVPSTDARNNLSTLAAVAHRITVSGGEAFLYLYRLTARTDIEPNGARELIDSIDLVGGGSLSLPAQLWTVPYSNAFDRVTLPMISNAYARSFNNTLLGEGEGETPTHPYDKVHMTIIQPCLVQADSGCAIEFSPETVDVFTYSEINLDRRNEMIALNSGTLPATQINAEYIPEEDPEPAHWSWRGYAGSRSVSIAQNILIQAHIAGETILLAQRSAANWLLWSVEEELSWGDLIAELAAEPVRTQPAWHFFNAPSSMNNAPAKIRDANFYPSRDPDTGEEVAPDTEQPADGFVTLYFSLFQSNYDPETAPENTGGTFESKLWLVKIARSNAGVNTYQSIALLTRETPDQADVMTLPSLDAAWSAHVIATQSGLYGLTAEVPLVTDTFHSYNCPEIVPCDGVIAAWECENPCWGACGGSAESSGCFCYLNTDTRSTQIARHTTLLQWGGFLAGDDFVLDAEGNRFPAEGSPSDLKQGINSILIPLPLAYPNLSSNDFSKCCWTAKSIGTGNLMDKEFCDPQVAVSKVDSKIYSVVIDSKFVYLPYLSTVITTQNDYDPSAGGFPEVGDILCGWEWLNMEYTFVSTNCASCLEGPYHSGGGGYFEEGPYLRNNYVVLPPGSVTGVGYLELTIYGTRKPRELRETKLIISDRDGTSVLAVPISKSFSGAKIVGEVIEHTLTEELPVAENCWQIGLWKDYVIMIIDERDEFIHSPRPTLQIRNRHTGALVAQYDELVRNTQYEDRWPDDDENESRQSSTKWCMWGRRSGACYAGPRFKLAHQVDKPGVTGDENKPLYIHLAGDLWKYPEDISIDFDIESIAEYRILKFDGSTLTVERDTARNMTTSFSAFDSYEPQIEFDETYPRPGTLAAMALIEGEALLPGIGYDEDSEETRWYLLSHQVEE